MSIFILSHILGNFHIAKFFPILQIDACVSILWLSWSILRKKTVLFLICVDSSWAKYLLHLLLRPIRKASTVLPFMCFHFMWAWMLINCTWVLLYWYGLCWWFRKFQFLDFYLYFAKITDVKFSRYKALLLCNTCIPYRGYISQVFNFAFYKKLYTENKIFIWFTPYFWLIRKKINPTKCISYTILLLHFRVLILLLLKWSCKLLQDKMYSYWFWLSSVFV